MNDTYVEPDVVPTDVIERAMRYAKSVSEGSGGVDDEGLIRLSELGLALESRLENTQRLLRHLLWYPHDPREALHAFGTLEHLTVESLELCWAIRELGSRIWE